MADQGTIQDWFFAALLHDLGKTRGWRSPEGRGHGDWSETPYAVTPALKEIAGRAKEHERGVFPDTYLDESAILALADKLQKGLYGWSALETGEGIPPEVARQRSQLLETPVFQSFYGAPVTWDKSHRDHLDGEIAQSLTKSASLGHLLELQREQLNAYPHTTFIPHLALGLHQQITAVLFFFLWRKVQREKVTTSAELNNFTVHAFAITPEALAFFYRLRYLDAYRDAAEALQSHLFRELFVGFQRDGLTQLTPQANPFQFFHGSSLVLLYDDEKKVVDALQTYLDSRPKVPLDSIQVQIHSYSLKEWGVNPAGLLFADPNAIERRVREFPILPKRSLQFAQHTETRCVYCGRPTPRKELDTLRTKNLCDTCLEIERQKGTVNLQAFCSEGRSDQYLGWVFLAFGAPLLSVAVEAAQQINQKFAAEHLIPPGILHPSETGLDEYLQALAAIQAFEDKCDQRIGDLGKGARTLARFAHLALYLLCEDNYWKFLVFLNEERERLSLPTSLRAMLSGPKYPVWSLMERGFEYDPQRRDVYYHIAEGSVVMFTATDVNTIRSLAQLAASENVTSSQLNSLVRVALRATLPELLLEIDVKAREGKLGRQRFAGQLKNGLDALKGGDDFTGREKRAIFIKYAAKLKGEDRR